VCFVCHVAQQQQQRSARLQSRRQLQLQVHAARLMLAVPFLRRLLFINNHKCKIGNAPNKLRRKRKMKMKMNSSDRQELRRPPAQFFFNALSLHSWSGRVPKELAFASVGDYLSLDYERVEHSMPISSWQRSS
jgi:hypothetical protein